MTRIHYDESHTKVHTRNKYMCYHLKHIYIRRLKNNQIFERYNNVLDPNYRPLLC